MQNMLEGYAGFYHENEELSLNNPSRTFSAYFKSDDASSVEDSANYIKNIFEASGIDVQKITVNPATTRADYGLKPLPSLGGESPVSGQFYSVDLEVDAGVEELECLAQEIDKWGQEANADPELEAPKPNDVAPHCAPDMP